MDCHHILKGLLGICKSIQGKMLSMHVWRRASGGDAMKNTMFVDGRTEIGSNDARELRENGGPLVMILGVDM